MKESGAGAGATDQPGSRNDQQTIAAKEDADSGISSFTTKRKLSLIVKRSEANFAT
jgi:hypothetical protein